MKLFTFTISHFSEKARWGLAHGGLEFEDVRLLPGPHNLTTRRLAQRSTVPLLVDGARVVQGSSDILDYAAAERGATRLAVPEAQRGELREAEARFDKAFGRGVQTIFYDVLLQRPRQVVGMWTQDGPRWGPAFYAVAMPLLAPLVRRAYCPSPERVTRAWDLFRREFDATDRVLAERPYVLGDAFSRADVTLAALLAPVARPPGHVVKWPDVPPEMAALDAEFRGRPTTEYVLRMYRDHRGARGN